MDFCFDKTKIFLLMKTVQTGAEYPNWVTCTSSGTKPYSSNNLLENEEKLLFEKNYVSCMIIYKEYTVKRFSEVLNLHHHYSTFPLIDV